MPPERKVLTAPFYERQDTEGDEAWTAFRTYRDMGHDRTLDQTWRKIGKESGYMRQVEEWSSQWSWGRRTLEWDRHLDTKRRAASERKVVEMAERQAKDAATLQDGIRPFIEALAQKSGVAVEAMTAGALAEYIKDLAPAFKTAVETERKARGLEDVTVRHTGTIVLDGLRHAFAERLKRRQDVAVMGESMGGSSPGDDGGPEPGTPSEPVSA